MYKYLRMKRFSCRLLSLIALAALFMSCAHTPEVKILAELLPLFTSSDIPAVGPDEDLDIGGPFSWIDSTKVTPAEWPGEGLGRYPMLLVGEGYNRICIIAEGKLVWKFDAGRGWELDDIWMLKNGDILFTRQAWAAKVTPDKRITWRYDCAPGEEIHTLQPVGEDRAIMLVNAFPARVVMFNHITGEVLWEKELEFDTNNSVHGQSRRLRYTCDDTYLVSYISENKVVEYDTDWNPIRQFDAHCPWSALRLSNGNTLITLEKERRTIEVDKEGNIVWEISLDELPEPYRIAGSQTATRLSNGNTILCSRGDKGSSPQMVEVTRDKEVVWVLDDWRYFGPVTSVQVLSEQGLSEVPGALGK